VGNNPSSLRDPGAGVDARDGSLDGAVDVDVDVDADSDSAKRSLAEPPGGSCARCDRGESRRVETFTLAVALTARGGVMGNGGVPAFPVGEGVRGARRGLGGERSVVLMPSVARGGVLGAGVELAPSPSPEAPGMLV
jgi:hypothetical protein